MKNRALFLDRDGTLVYPAHYPSRPQDLHLYENIGPELCALQKMGFSIVLITNQSGIARGYFTELDLQHMHIYLAAELEKWGVRLDAIYYCPHHPDGIVPELSIRCACRKPQPGMLLRAADELDIELERSWFIGDILDDVEAGNRAGCQTILIDLGTERRPEAAVRCPSFVAPSTLQALRLIQTVEALAPTLDLVYRPEGWRKECELARGYRYHLAGEGVDPCKI
ncbi:HAD family hydrolase [Ktedonosporobacter rubrisoli]|uniref:D,D-heptose 1,7-bisphosphate phosphatase n=2 Tax=Ktedonosporobacter rubrisoli TaxID=2509675 RepID=A0A4P6K5M0_KTERU|nr:HAD family hydrolase [Ktedonosporobacter rubrisoli]